MEKSWEEKAKELYKNIQRKKIDSDIFELCKEIAKKSLNLKLTPYQISELANLHGELIQLLQQYNHLQETKRWQKLMNDTMSDYRYLCGELDRIESELIEKSNTNNV